MEDKEYTVEEVLQIIRKWNPTQITQFLKLAKPKSLLSEQFANQCKAKGLQKVTSYPSGSGNQVKVSAYYKNVKIQRIFNGTCTLDITVLDDNNMITNFFDKCIGKFNTIEKAMDFIDNRIDILRNEIPKIVSSLGLKLKERLSHLIYELDVTCTAYSTGGIRYTSDSGWMIDLIFNEQHHPNRRFRFNPNNITKWSKRSLLCLVHNRHRMKNSISIITLTKKNAKPPYLDLYLCDDDIGNPNKKICIKCLSGVVVDIEDKKIGYSYYIDDHTWHIIWRSGSDEEIAIVKSCVGAQKK